MQRRIVQSICIAISVITVGIMMVGCNKGISFKVGEEITKFAVRMNDLTVIVRSSAELESVSNENYHTSSLTNEKNYYLKGLTEKYDDEYFKSKALIIYSFGYQGTTPTVKKIVKEKDEIKIILKQNNVPSIGADQYTTFALEVKLKDIKGVSKISVS